MDCNNPQCDGGVVPNPRSSDPDDVTLCPDEYPEYDPAEFLDYHEG
ncbi:hypothetical protein OHU07_19745 [Streptomyces phaeochromogenes]